MHAGVVGQLVALLVPGAGHSEDAEVVQDAATLQRSTGSVQRETKLTIILDHCL